MIYKEEIGKSMSRFRMVYSLVNDIMLSLQQQQQVVIAFTFLRRIDCLIGKYAKQCFEFYQRNKDRYSDDRMFSEIQANFGGFPFYNVSGLNFDSILLSDKTIDIVLETYIQGFSYNVQEILEGMQFRSNLAIMQRNSKYIELVFRMFQDINLSLSAFDNEEFVELLYSIIERTETSHARSSSMTPLPLANLMTEVLFQRFLPRKSSDNIISIYDPVCGKGSLLAYAYNKAMPHLFHHHLISLFGQDIDILSISIAKAVTLLLGNEYSEICHGDTLANDMFPSRKFDYILADMPLGLSWKHIKEHIEKDSYINNGRFAAGLPNVNESQFLFIEHMVSKMSESGSRVVFCTTGSILWGGTASSGESRIRRWLFENDLVETIISLPKGTLSYTGIPVYLWILSNRKNVLQKGKVRLIDTTSLITKESRFFLSHDFVKTVVDEYKSKIVSKMSQIVNNEQFGYYEVDLLVNGKKKERVEISIDTDIHEFIEKERLPYTKGDITVDYSSVEKGYSVRFEKFFTQEQIDITSLVAATKDLVPVIDAIASLKTDITKILGGTDSKSWTELPLRVAIEVVSNFNRPSVTNIKGLPLLSVPYLRGKSEDETHYEVTPKTKYSTEKDTILVVRGANTGEVFKGKDGILTPSVASIKCTDENIITPKYLYYLLKGHEKALKSMAMGAEIKYLNSKTILDFKCMIPPIEEQLRLVSYLDVIIGKIDNVIKGLGSNGSVFSAYRQTLIENVVRGKVLIK